LRVALFFGGLVVSGSASGGRAELAAVAFLAVAFLAVAFLAVAFLAVAFLAVAFLAVAFLAVAFLAVAFLVVAFLAGLPVALVDRFFLVLAPVADGSAAVFTCSSVGAGAVCSGSSPPITGASPFPCASPIVLGGGFDRLSRVTPSASPARIEGSARCRLSTTFRASLALPLGVAVAVAAQTDTGPPE